MFSPFSFLNVLNQQQLLFPFQIPHIWLCWPDPFRVRSRRSQGHAAFPRRPVIILTDRRSVTAKGSSFCLKRISISSRIAAMEVSMPLFMVGEPTTIALELNLSYHVIFIGTACRQLNRHFSLFPDAGVWLQPSACSVPHGIIDQVI